MSCTYTNPNIARWMQNLADALVDLAKEQRAYAKVQADVTTWLAVNTEAVDWAAQETHWRQQVNELTIKRRAETGDDWKEWRNRLGEVSASWAANASLPLDLSAEQASAMANWFAELRFTVEVQYRRATRNEYRQPNETSAALLGAEARWRYYSKLVNERRAHIETLLGLQSAWEALSRAQCAVLDATDGLNNAVIEFAHGE